MLGGTPSATDGSPVKPSPNASAKKVGGRTKKDDDEWKQFLKPGEDENNKKARQRAMTALGKTEMKEAHKGKKGMKHLLMFIVLSKAVVVVGVFVL